MTEHSLGIDVIVPQDYGFKSDDIIVFVVDGEHVSVGSVAWEKARLRTAFHYGEELGDIDIDTEELAHIIRHNVVWGLDVRQYGPHGEQHLIEATIDFDSPDVRAHLGLSEAGARLMKTLREGHEHHKEPYHAAALAMEYGPRAVADAAADLLTAPVEANLFTTVSDAVLYHLRRAWLLDALNKHRWNLTRVAEELRIGSSGSVIRFIKDLDLNEHYEQARREGLIARGQPRRK